VPNIGTQRNIKEPGEPMMKFGNSALTDASNNDSQVVVRKSEPSRGARGVAPPGERCRIVCGAILGPFSVGAGADAG
jgi:hypothetical protein